MTAVLASGLTGLFALAAGLGTMFLQQRHQRAMAQEERLWGRRADIYVHLLQFQRQAMIEGYRGAATASDWAVRDELTARANAFASDTVRGLWQQSAQASLDLGEYVSENFPESGAVRGAAQFELEQEMERDADFRRVQQASIDAGKRLAEQIRAELGSAREGSAHSFKRSTGDD